MCRAVPVNRNQSTSPSGFSVCPSCQMAASCNDVALSGHSSGSKESGFPVVWTIAQSKMGNGSHPDPDGACPGSQTQSAVVPWGMHVVWYCAVQGFGTHAAFETQSPSTSTFPRSQRHRAAAPSISQRVRPDSWQGFCSHEAGFSPPHSLRSATRPSIPRLGTTRLGFIESLFVPQHLNPLEVANRSPADLPHSYAESGAVVSDGPSCRPASMMAIARGRRRPHPLPIASELSFVQSFDRRE